MMYHVFVALLNFFGLVFIDASYNKTLKVQRSESCACEESYKSVLAVTAIARCEVTESYSRLEIHLGENKTQMVASLYDIGFCVPDPQYYLQSFPSCCHI